MSMLLPVLVSATAVALSAPRIYNLFVAPLADRTEHLRVLIANECKDRLALVAPIVAALGHEVIAREIEVEDVGAVTARERPDVALVGLGASSEHALDLIDKIVREAACPSLPSWPRSISRETSTGAPRLDASFRAQHGHGAAYAFNRPERGTNVRRCPRAILCAQIPQR